MNRPGDLYTESGQTLQGSFSSVSKPSQILQENMRWKALDEIYKIYLLLHRLDLNVSENSRKNAKKFYEILLRFSLSTGAKECQSCRSRKMLKNAYLDAKIGFDTEENEPSKV